jgi:hypothetical protein
MVSGRNARITLLSSASDPCPRIILPINILNNYLAAFLFFSPRCVFFWLYANLFTQPVDAAYIILHMFYLSMNNNNYCVQESARYLSHAKIVCRAEP